MVNSKNLLTAGVVSLAVASIITYMSVNGLTTNDISLVDACYKASQVKGINVATCDELKQHNYEWDTSVPCAKAFKEDLYFWTPRMMFGYYSGGKTEIAALGRKNKGTEKQVIYTAAMNLTFAEALMDRCGPAENDEEFPIFKSLWQQMSSGVAAEDVDVSEFEDRNLYSWNQALSWIISALCFAIGAIFAAVLQPVADATNYKACSVGLAFQKLVSGIQDHAECSGNNPTKCRRWHYVGPSGWWNNHHRGSSNRLNNGCVQHDKCLNKSLSSYWSCDEGLKNASKQGIAWKWPGFSCGWRGCRGWWFGWTYSTGDSRVTAGCVYITMKNHPNA